MNAVLGGFERVASGRVVGVALVGVAAILGAENVLDFPGSVPHQQRLTGQPFLDLCAFCSADRIQAHLEAFGEVGRRLQLEMLLSVDLVIPVACLFAASLALAWSRAPRWLRLLPFLALALDLTENALILGLLALWPTGAPAIASVLGWVTGLKFVAYGASGVAAAVSVVTRPARRP